MSDSGHVIGENDPHHPNFIGDRRASVAEAALAEYKAGYKKLEDSTPGGKIPPQTLPPPDEILARYAAPPDPRDVTIAVLREHVAFLQDMLKKREDYWQLEYSQASVHLEGQRELNARLRVALAEAAEHAQNAVYAAKNEYDVQENDADWYRNWVDLAYGGAAGKK